ncbi:hypothetical protein [Methylobacterium radiotolerans]|uniref:Uncharacterized protein n=1 Tax=Methylobacterium radiotolerans (strain ATCC 27329 / DSM 1819 / JCM 2831 / NBRC 15690 / NCIMB 10815 / 0-1) TaxID=426355 RepID=B1LW95_METRJ|nr:hypothetical protein [Methylobacterium radiotolerans]ACB27158.1 conserved hypothetical protein [Methylobacterium radiotolerans JCM 2831]GEM98359.1 hypothetical protein MRA01_28990 [Methylobacterium radiotolerans]
MRTAFGDGLVTLDARETRARLAEAMAAVKAHPAFATGPRSKALQDAVGAVERALLMSAREAIHTLDVALVEADRPPTAATAAEAHAAIVADLDADAPPAPSRSGPPLPPVGRPRVTVPPPRPRLPPRP